MQYVFAKIEEYNTASELGNSVNVPKAIQLVSNAWGKVKSEIICKCFRKAGALDEDFNVTSDIVQQENGDDSFQDIDREFQLSDLIPQVVTSNTCSINE